MNRYPEKHATVSRTGEEIYSLVDAQSQRDYVEARTAAMWVSFFLPHLRSGMSLLDCGCGVGSITLDLATIVAPGQVVGLDTDPGQLDIARSHAQKRGLTNVRFEVASVYELPFADSSFAAVLAHTLLIHLSDPLKTLKEIRRILKPGGIVAVSDDDFSTVVISPSTPLLEKFFQIWPRILGINGGSPSYARHLRRLLLEAGFARTEGHAVAAECYGTLEATRHFVSLAGRLLRHATLVEVMIGQGLTDQEELDAMIDGMRCWAKRPDAFLAWMYCAALGWVAEDSH